MAVKIRLRRMGAKKLLSTELLLLIQEAQEMVDSSKKLGTTIQ